MSKHTPGPWNINKYGAIEADSCEIGLVYGDDDFTFSRTENVNGKDIICRANAKIISAAPDLLVVCQGDNWCSSTLDYFQKLLEMLAVLTPDNRTKMQLLKEGHTRIYEIRAAIKKATE